MRVEEEMRLFARLENESSEGVSDQKAEGISINDNNDTNKEEVFEKRIISNSNKETRVLRDRNKIRKPERLSYPQINITKTELIIFEEALHSSEAEQWKEAIQQELSAHRKDNTFSSLKLDNKKIITCK